MAEHVFLLPDVGEGLIEADLVEWKVAVGDHVTLNQTLCEVETAKAVVELPSPFAGVVTALHAQPGDTVEVHKPLVTIDDDASSTKQAAPSTPAAGRTETDSTPATSEKAFGEGRQAVLIGYGVADESGAATRRHRRATTATTPPPIAVRGVVRSTPPVRLYAKQHGIDISTVVGTGRDGLITRADVERLLSSSTSTRVATGPTHHVAPTRFAGHDLASFDDGPSEERIPVKSVLKSMADSMSQSSRDVPHAAVWQRFDATGTIELLAQLKERPALADVRLSPLVIVALAVIDAARHFPGINSTFDAAAKEVVIHRYVNLGIAADTPRGLIVPNIKDAHLLDLIGLANSLTSLVSTARAGTTTPADMARTTLTVTNVGPMGVDAAVPILPPGTSGIFAVGAIKKAPWVVNDAVVVRHVGEVVLSFDHRHVDGAYASRALAHVAHFLESPAAHLLVG